MAEEKFPERYQRLLLGYMKTGLRDYHLLNDYFETGGNFEGLEKLAKKRIEENECDIRKIKEKIEEKLQK